MTNQLLRNKPLANIRNMLILAFASFMAAFQCHAAFNNEDNTMAALVLRAQSALANGQAHQAAEWFEQAAAIGESAEAEIGLVRAYLQTGEFRKAIAFGNLVASEHPDVSETAALLAYLEDREGHTTPALAKLSEELKKHPDDVALFASQTEIMIDRMAIHQAIKQLDDWIKRNPPQGDIYRLRARAALVAGNREDLINWRRKAVLAYESKGEFEVARPLRNWLAKAYDNNLTASEDTVSLTQAGEPKPGGKDNETPFVTRWPVHGMETFPLDTGKPLKSGNGFVVDRGRRIVTYASLVSRTNVGVFVRNGLGKIRKARVEKILPDQGLALLRLEIPYAKEWSLQKQTFAVPEGVHFCFVLGFPVTDDLEKGYPVLAPGLVVRPDAGFAGLMQITSSLGPENSGSPVFDNSGKFIGLTLGRQVPLKGVKDRDTQLGQGTFAIRVDNLQKIVTKSGRSAKKIPKAPSKETPSVEELYEKLLPAVVMIVVPD